MNYAAAGRLLGGEVHISAQDGMGRDWFGKHHGELHLRCSGFVNGSSFLIGHSFSADFKWAQIRSHNLQNIAFMEFVTQAAHSGSVFITAFHNGANLPLADVTGVFGVLTRKTEIETGGVNPVSNLLHFSGYRSPFHPQTPGNTPRVAFPLQARTDSGRAARRRRGWNPGQSYNY